MSLCADSSLEQGGFEGRLRSHEWVVRTVSLGTAAGLVSDFHYAKGSANTAVYRHGLFARGDDLFDGSCVGVAIWIPPTKSAAMATFPEDWKAVLSLSRLVIVPGVPKNACTFLLARSRRLIDRKRWPCLVTYADEWRGHSGAIYRADNWVYVGRTAPERVYTLSGRMIARKAGPKTRTHAEMLALGAQCEGAFAKNKFIHITRARHESLR